MKTQSERVTSILEKFNEENSTPINKAIVEKILNLEAADIEQDIIQTGKTKVAGIGNVEVRYIKPRQGRNPKTNEVIPIPEHLKLALNPSKKIKTLIEENIDIEKYRKDTETAE